MGNSERDEGRADTVPTSLSRPFSYVPSERILLSHQRAIVWNVLVRNRITYERNRPRNEPRRTCA
jgi:hypothetical protein